MQAERDIASHDPTVDATTPAAATPAAAPTIGVGDAIEAPSGKGATDENFPVGSWLIAPRLRPHVMAYYAFARGTDDIADDETLAPEEKIRRLDACEAAVRSGRAPDAVRLVLVSKTVSPERIREAIRHGQTDLGENKVQEGRKKAEALADLPLRW
ncbi:MAG: squalene/phytoene synthase family protein, partial [Pseudomonadota bacterium]